MLAMTRALASAIVAVAMAAIAAARSRDRDAQSTVTPSGTIADVVAGRSRTTHVTARSRQARPRLDASLVRQGPQEALERARGRRDHPAARDRRRTASKLLHFRCSSRARRRRGFNVEFGNLKSEEVQGALHDKLLEKLAGDGSANEGRARDDDESDDDDGDEDETSAKPKKEDGDDDDDPRRPSATRARRERRRPKGGDDDEDSEESRSRRRRAVKTTAAHRRTAIAIRVDFGISVIVAHADVHVAVDFEPGAEAATRTRRCRAVALEGELYPFAFCNPNSAAAGLGFAGEFDQTLVAERWYDRAAGHDSRSRSSTGRSALRYRIAFGPQADEPDVDARRRLRRTARSRSTAAR